VGGQIRFEKCGKPALILAPPKLAPNVENCKNERAFSDPSGVPTFNSVEAELSPGSAESANVDDVEFDVFQLGSTTTGNTRPGSRNHTESMLNARAGDPSTVVSWYATACEVAGLPGRESDIDPGGTTARTDPELSTKDTDPFDSTRAVKPCNRNGNTHDVPAEAESSTSDSFTPVDVVVNDRSVPGSAPPYVSVEPDTVGVTVPAPCNP
jgi:hypothetical protein